MGMPTMRRLQARITGIRPYARYARYHQRRANRRFLRGGTCVTYNKSVSCFTRCCFAGRSTPRNSSLGSCSSDSASQFALQTHVTNATNFFTIFGRLARGAHASQTKATHVKSQESYRDADGRRYGSLVLATCLAAAQVVVLPTTRTPTTVHWLEQLVLRIDLQAHPTCTVYSKAVDRLESCAHVSIKSCRLSHCHPRPWFDPCGER